MAKHKIYRIPKNVAPMTLNLDLRKKGFFTVKDYVEAKNFALTADLLSNGFKPSDIEIAVNSQYIHFAHFPEHHPMTDLYWAKGRKTFERLYGLAEEAVKLCSDDKKKRQLGGGNIISIGASMGSQQMALVGLVYAREQEKLREIPELSQRGAGPFYVVRGGYSDVLITNMLSLGKKKSGAGGAGMNM